MSRFARLSLADRSNLRLERPETPAHVAGLCVVEARPLLDSSGELDLATIWRRLDRRLARAPELRRVVHRPPPLCGPALWVDDPGLSIERHVHAVRVAPPGDEASLLETAERLLRPPLERSHPLWELWLLTGLQGDQLGGHRPGRERDDGLRRALLSGPAGGGDRRRRGRLPRCRCPRCRDESGLRIHPVRVTTTGQPMVQRL